MRRLRLSIDIFFFEGVDITGGFLDHLLVLNLWSLASNLIGKSHAALLRPRRTVTLVLDPAIRWEVAQDRCPPDPQSSSTLMGCSLINQPFGGTPICGNPRIGLVILYLSMYVKWIAGEIGVTIPYPQWYKYQCYSFLSTLDTTTTNTTSQWLFKVLEFENDLGKPWYILL